MWLRQYDKYVSIQGINEDKMTVTVSDDLSAHIGDSYRVIVKAMVPCLESYEDLDKWSKNYESYFADVCDNGKLYDFEQRLFTTMVYILHDNTSKYAYSDSRHLLPKSVEKSWISYNEMVYECFVEYMSNKMSASKSSQGLPLHNQQKPCNATNSDEQDKFLQWAKSKKIAGALTGARSPFAALSGKGDKFSSVFDFFWSCRDGSFASPDMIPTLDPPRSVHASLDLIREGKFAHEAKSIGKDPDAQRRLEEHDRHLRRFYSCMEQVFKFVEEQRGEYTIPKRAYVVFHAIKKIKDDFGMKARGPCNHYINTGYCARPSCIDNHPMCPRIHEGGNLRGIPLIIRRFDPEREESMHIKFYKRRAICKSYQTFADGRSWKRFPMCTFKNCSYHHPNGILGEDEFIRSRSNPPCGSLRDNGKCENNYCYFNHSGAEFIKGKWINPEDQVYEGKNEQQDVDYFDDYNNEATGHLLKHPKRPTISSLDFDDYDFDSYDDPDEFF